MSSRRLAISSLLCSGDDDKPPMREEHQRVPTSPLPAAASPSHHGDRDSNDELPTSTPPTFASAAHHTLYESRRVPVSDLLHSGRDAPGARHQALTTPRFASSRTITPLPLALQPATPQHRTPSPPPMSLPASPNGQGGLEEEYTDDEGFVSSSYDRDYPPELPVAQPMYATPATAAYSQYSSPPSSSSGLVADPPLGRASLPVSSFRFSPPVPRRPLPIETTHDYEHHPQTSTYLQDHSTSPTEKVLPVHHVKGQSFVHSTLSVNTLDNRIPQPAISPVHSRPPPSAGLSGLDALVQAATEERERIDEHRRISGGSDRLHSSRDEAGQIHSPISAGGPRSSRLSPEWRIRPFQSQVHPHSFMESTTAEQPRTIYNYTSHDVTTSRRRTSTPSISPSVESDAKATLTNALHRNQQNLPHTFTRTPTLSVDVPGGSLLGEGSEATTSESHVAASLEELSLARSLPSRSQPSPTYERQRLPEDQLKRRGSGSLGLAPIPGQIQGRRSPPRSKPKLKPGSAAINSAEKQLHHRQVSEESSAEDHHKHAHPGRKHFKHEIQHQEARYGERPTSKKRHISLKHAGRPNAHEELEEGEDSDAHDFFLSVFDSPRHAASRQVPSEVTSQELLKQQVIHQHAPTFKTPQTHKNAPSESDMDDDFINAARGSSAEGTINASDVEEDLADAVANSGFESGGDMGSEAADAMDVDVEDELLSLVEPSQSDNLQTGNHRHASALAKEVDQSRHVGEHSRLSPETRDRLSMPPPASTKAGKANKKDISGTKASLNKDSKDSKPSKKTSSTKGEDSMPRPTKTKAPSKPKAKVSSEKLKGAKQAPEIVEALSPSISAGSLLAASNSMDDFPTVTSSGRMVKKSIASTLAAQSAASTSKKRVVASSSANADGLSSRSRSHSVMPRASVDPENDKDKDDKEKKSKVEEERAKDEEETTNEDDKLYCICQTRYDEDRVMIACDRCDEWYHTQCVKMPDLQVDLVDQFICPTCVKRNPGLNLKTTYKPRCFTGLKHAKPNSTDACHRPARGAFSKYCSDECGVKYMHSKLQSWAGKGGEVERLWESVKNAKPREGVVVKEPGRVMPKKILAELSNLSPPNVAPTVHDNTETHMNVDQTSAIEAQENNPSSTLDTVSKQKIMSLQAQLCKFVSERDERKKEMDVVDCRRRLLSLAIARADRVGECGWDQRLCFGDEEWKEFGDDVLQSYEASADEMDVDEQESVWWCRGEKKCERHAGWQKLRERELNNEREERTDVLVQLTTRERDIRNRIEDILHPKMQGDASSISRFTLANGTSGKEDGTKKKKKGGR